MQLNTLPSTVKTTSIKKIPLTETRRNLEYLLEVFKTDLSNQIEWKLREKDDCNFKYKSIFDLLFVIKRAEARGIEMKDLHRWLDGQKVLNHQVEMDLKKETA